MDSLQTRSNNLDAGAMLAMFSGGIGIIVSVLIFIGWTRYGSLVQITGVTIFVAAVLAIWGTRRYVLTGRNYSLAVLFGGVCSVMCGLVFGVIALIAIVASRKEF